VICSVLQCVAVCCGVLRCVAVCCKRRMEQQTRLRQTLGNLNSEICLQVCAVAAATYCNTSRAMFLSRLHINSKKTTYDVKIHLIYLGTYSVVNHMYALLHRPCICISQSPGSSFSQTIEYTSCKSTPRSIPLFGVRWALHTLQRVCDNIPLADVYLKICTFDIRDC